MIGVPQLVEVVSEPSWGFDNEGPSYTIKFPEFSDESSWGTTVKVDPAPCYTHDIELVKDELAHLQEVMPLPIPLKIVLLSHEPVGRTNGTYYNKYLYAQSYENYRWFGIIVLAGKRIPIHPAMTRYLVSHEYGHGVQYALERLHGLKEDKMEPDYIARLRPDATNNYGPGKWHTNVGELIANDFRLLVAEREQEFWPHANYTRPEQIPALMQFWEKAQRELRAGVVKAPLYAGLSLAPHPSHWMITSTNTFSSWRHCDRCMLREDEEQIQWECALR
jgi:hypothetical protein